MKIVKIIIDKKIERIVNFDSKYDNKNNHYVIKNTDGKREHDLFSIKSTDGKICVSQFKTEKKDQNVKLIITLVENNIKPDKKEENGILKEENGILYDGNYFKIKNHGENCCCEVQLILKNGNDTNEYATKTFYIHLDDQVFDAIIDFGSEASQACWKSRSEIRKTLVNITEAILKKRNGQEKQATDNAERLEDYIQYESRTLYRSIYYMKKQLDELNPDPWPDYKNDTIRFLMKNDEDPSGKLILIPNTKIMFFDTARYVNQDVIVKGISVPIYTLNGDGLIQRLLLNNMAYQALQAIQDYTTTIENKKCCVVLNVLMPNVYPIHIINRKLSCLAEDIEKLIKKNKEENKGVLFNIKAIELRAVSESDASLLGYLNGIRTPDDKVKYGNYLIIDAGKGTLDMSIMNVSGNGYINKSRSGIVGAGNAITYGVMIAFVNEFLKQSCNDYKKDDAADKIRQFIYKHIIQNGAGESRDIASLNNMMKSLENYKKLYNDANNEKKTIPNNDDKYTYEAIIKGNDIFQKFANFIETYNKETGELSEDSRKYISAEIDKIVDEMIVPLKNMLCDNKKTEEKSDSIKDNNKKQHKKIEIKNVVFTGRGCLMNELRKRILERLKSESLIGNDTKIVPIKSDDPYLMKTMCLNIFELLNGGAYDASPYEQTSNIIDPVEEDDDNPEKTGNSHDNSNNIIDRSARPYGQGGYGGNSGNRGNSGNLFDGIPIGRVITANSRLNISGWQYTIDRMFLNQDCKLYFDGMSYWLVSTHNNDIIDKLDDHAIGVQQANLGFESLFPNVVVEDNELGLISIPVIKESDASEKTDTSKESTGEKSLNKVDEKPIEQKKGIDVLIEKVEKFVNRIKH